MKKENPVQEKSYALALQIVELYRYLTEEKKEFVLSKQILRSGTSIGANVEEAEGAQSEKDFLLFNDIEEVLKLIGSIQKTLKHKLYNHNYKL